MNNILPLIKMIFAFIPVYLLLVLNRKTNLKPLYRSRQFLMPPITLIYSIVVIILLKKMIDWSWSLTSLLSGLLQKVGSLIPVFDNLGKTLESLLVTQAVPVAMVALNTLAIAVFLIIKRILISIFQSTFHPGNMAYEYAAGIFYEPDKEGNWYIKESTIQARSFLQILHTASIIISFLVFFVSMILYKKELMQLPSVPVLGILIIGEMFFYIDGISKKEAMGEIEGEGDGARGRYNYRAVRKVLRELFGDKLADEDTTIHTDILNPISPEETIEKYLIDDSNVIETYGKYMNAYRASGHTLDSNYLASGRELLEEKSILFNNPFYYDLIPYAFYAMNHKLLQHRKVLLVLGRHGIEDDVLTWCINGLRAITNVEGLWKIGILTEKMQDLDVGIITRSDLQNLELHKENASFFMATEYVVLIEPSKMVTTAQIGLNSLIRYCRQGEDKKITFCSTDKNCDGLIDALSHVLLTSISMVSATEAHTGACSYMCWSTDDEYWQHRMLPNISRYLGVGTELSMVALKNQISKTKWFGGEKFPVVDMHWIAKQYYGDLLSYAGLPVSQEVLDQVFTVSPNLWNAKREKNSYVVVEDELNNVFEMKRVFSTRSTNQAFVNIVSSPYLLCDYMTDNKGIFNADPKAIPYIVADYVATKRNVLLRTCVEMTTGYVWESDLIEELMVAGIVGEKITRTLWENLCNYYNPVAGSEKCHSIHIEKNGNEYTFTSSVIEKHSRYNIESGKDEVCYHISNEDFIHTVLGDMTNARYIAEEEDKKSYIGTESLGQIFQKYLPGQFFTLNGKYYEMLNVTFDGRVLLRRAADHITGRKAYRQVRQYTINYAENDEQMGAEKKYNKMEVTRQYADISVVTPAYWDLSAYNDFAHGQRVEINGIPARSYYNKMMLKVSFNGSGEEFSDKIRYTLTSMINEVFRSLFADNQDMVVAVTAGEHGIPLTYDLTGEYEGFDPKAIYIIEDSQYDLGLLTAVERNLMRIFQIITDYLQWNEESIIASEEDHEEEEKDFTLNNEDVAEEEKNYQENKDKEEKEPQKKGIFSKIAGWFKKLFKKKEKTPKPEEASVPVAAEEEATSEKDEVEAASDDTLTEEPASSEPEAGDASASAEVKTEGSEVTETEEKTEGSEVTETEEKSADATEGNVKSEEKNDGKEEPER